jgi:hypothetical protein
LEEIGVGVVAYSLEKKDINAPSNQMVAHKFYPKNIRSGSGNFRSNTINSGLNTKNFRSRQKFLPKSIGK